MVGDRAPFDGAKGAFAFIAEVEEISGDRYFPKVIERLKEAKEWSKNERRARWY